MPPPINVTKTKNGAGIRDLAKRLERLKNTDVLVGIPAEKAVRKGDSINNASLLFIHTYGSPARNIPARPVLQPAVKADWKLIQPHMREAAKLTTQRNVTVAEAELRRAGMAASNAAKRWFTDSRNNWAPLHPATILRKGSDLPLIDTGQMRRSITYALRVKKK